MARTIKQIQQAMIDAKVADPTLAGLTSTSSVAIWRLWTYIVAVGQYVLESFFDFHKAEVQGIIATQKPHTLQWYGTMAKAFQFGATLPADTDAYSPVAPAGDPSLIVTQSAAVELPSLLRIKVAKGAVGALVALSGGELTAFTTYMNRIKDAGVRLSCTSAVGDTFQTTLKIYYDPLVLDGSGARLDGSDATPVQNAINLFLNSLPFNGVFDLDKYIDAIEAVEGVKVTGEISCQAFFAATPPVVIDGTNPTYIPDAGYLVLDTVWFGTHVTYVPSL